MRDRSIDLVLRAFEGFARRDVEALRSLTTEDFELIAPTGQIANDGRPYVGHDGLRRYLADAASVWQELRVVPQRYGTSGEHVVTLGRVYGRDFDGGVTDAPAGWIWTLNEGAIRSAHVYSSHEDALDRSALAESELQPLKLAPTPNGLRQR